MEVCRLCLQNILSSSNFTPLEGNYKQMVQVIAPELDLEISNAPVLCISCTNSVDELFSFKMKCFENEKHLKGTFRNSDKNNSHGKETLEGFKRAEGVTLKTENTKERMCRMCLHAIDSESFTVLNPTEPNGYLNSMLNVCFPEIDLELTGDAVICEKCLDNVQRFHHFHSSYVDVETKLKNYCHLYGVNTNHQINLYSVLQTDIFKFNLESVSIKSETNVATNAESELMQEELNIKCETENTVSNSWLDGTLANEYFPHLLLKNSQDNDMQLQFTENGSSEALNKLFVCDICNKEFPQKAFLKRHWRLHTLERPYECQVCERHFAKKAVLKRHMRTHASKKQYKCETCDQKFLRKRNLDKHLIVHTSERSFKCKPYDEKVLKEVHLKRHRKIRTPSRRYKCKLCEKHFSKKALLERHMDTHNSKIQYKCLTCDKILLGKSSLDRHLTIHKDERPFKCEICHKGFSKEAYLKGHWRVHALERPFECELCERNFSKRAVLKRHMKKTHCGARPFICEVCNKGFRQETYLKRHSMTHITEGPYRCELCKKHFSEKAVLEQHLSIHADVEAKLQNSCVNTDHQINLYSVLQTDMLKFNLESVSLNCETGVATKTESELTQEESNIKREIDEIVSNRCLDATLANEYFPHLLLKNSPDNDVQLQFSENGSSEQRNTTEKSLICEICKKCFFNRDILKQHMITHTKEFAQKYNLNVCSNERPFKCQTCDKAFVRKRNLDRHLIVHTGERPFKCEMCHKDFSEEAHLRGHWRIHTLESPYKCELCEKHFSKKAVLKRHMRSHTSVKQYKCATCDKEFVLKRNLDRHLIVHTHTDVGAKFKNQYDLYGINTNHQMNLYNELQTDVLKFNFESVSLKCESGVATRTESELIQEEIYIKCERENSQ